jgi:hypothetical protein
MKIDLLTNATVVDDAIWFVSGTYENKLKLLDNDSEYDKEESNKPDYGEDRDQLKEEEEETEETTTTINQIF